MIFDTILSNKEKCHFETKEELTFDKALIFANARGLTDNTYYKIIIRNNK